MYDRRKCQAIVSEANQPHISFKIKSFNLINNKHFLELLHHLLTTKIFFYFPRPIPTLRRYGTTPSIRNISSILKSKQDVKAKTSTAQEQSSNTARYGITRGASYFANGGEHK